MNSKDVVHLAFSRLQHHDYDASRCGDRQGLSIRLCACQLPAISRHWLYKAAAPSRKPGGVAVPFHIVKPDGEGLASRAKRYVKLVVHQVCEEMYPRMRLKTECA